MPDDIRKQLKRANLLIQKGQKADALAILRPLGSACPNDPEVWWLTANALEEPAMIRITLLRALQADPTYDPARLQLARLESADAKLSVPATDNVHPPANVPVTLDDLPLILPPDQVPPEHTYPEEKPKGGYAKRKTRIVWYGALIVAIVVLGSAALFLLTRPAPKVGMPLLGPYYPRNISVPRGQGSLNCAQWTLTGHIVEGSGIRVRMWTDNKSLDTSTTTDGQGDFKFVVVRDALKPNQAGGIATEPFHLRLYNAQNSPISGIVDWQFIRTCTDGMNFQRQSVLDRTSPVLWPGPYIISYSQPTGTPVFTCDFTGFIGTAHDDNGPINGLRIEVWEEGAITKGIYTTYTGENTAVGGGGWEIMVRPGRKYVINILNHRGQPTFTRSMYLPYGDCDARLILIAITQSSR